MANDCLNWVEITAPMNRLEYLLRGPSPLADLDSPLLTVLPPVFALLNDLEEAYASGEPRLTLQGGRLAIVFETAWDPPTESVESFAKAHPDLAIVHCTAEPGMGVFTRCAYAGGLRTASVDFASESEAICAFLADGWDYEGDFRLNTALLFGALAVRQFHGAHRADAA